MYKNYLANLDFITKTSLFPPLYPEAHSEFCKLNHSPLKSY